MPTSDAARAVAILGMGWLGRSLAWACYRRGWAVTAAKRRLSETDRHLPFAVQAVDIGVVEVFDWVRWAAYPTWVCLLPPSCSADYVSGIRRWLGYARQFGVHHVLYSSSISVYGAHNGVCDEFTPPAPCTDSARRVLAAEEAFLDSGIAHIDMARLGGLYGDDRHPLFHLQKNAANPNPHTPVNMVSQTQAVAALMALLAAPDGVRIRNVVAQEHSSRREFYTQEAARLGVAAPCFAEDTADTAAQGKRVVSRFQGA